MRASRSYILCATPRSGSTLLCDLLSDTGVAGRPDSYFRRESIPDWVRHLSVPTREEMSERDFDRAFLAAVLKEGAGGTSVFALRLMWDSVEELSGKLRTLYPGCLTDADRFGRAFGKVQYIHLTRQDKVAQAVSLLKALETGLWHVGTDGRERERTKLQGCAAYDASRLAGQIEELNSQDREWLRWFDRNRIKPVRITYEDLSQDPQAVLAALLQALGLDHSIAARLKPRTRKLADAQSRDWISRFRSETADEPT